MVNNAYIALQWLQYCSLLLQHGNSFYNIVIGIVGGLIVCFSDQNVLRKIPHWLVRLFP